MSGQPPEGVEIRTQIINLNKPTYQGLGPYRGTQKTCHPPQGREGVDRTELEATRSRESATLEEISYMLTYRDLAESKAWVAMAFIDALKLELHVA